MVAASHLDVSWTAERASHHDGDGRLSILAASRFELAEILAIAGLGVAIHP